MNFVEFMVITSLGVMLFSLGVLTTLVGKIYKKSQLAYEEIVIIRRIMQALQKNYIAQVEDEANFPESWTLDEETIKAVNKNEKG